MASQDALKILKNIKKETSDLLNKFQYQNNIVFTCIQILY